MRQYIIRRLIGMSVVVWLVTASVFFLMAQVPGDPILARYGEDLVDLTPEQQETLRKHYGLDRPLLVQYGSWVWGVARGDLGQSIAHHQPVIDLIKQRLPATLQIQILTLIVVLVVALPAGVIAAVRRNTLADKFVSVFALAGLAMPSFWLGILLILLFSVNLGWLPVAGYVSIMEDPITGLKYSILPVVTSAFGGTAAVVMRQTRSSVLEVLDQDYIRTARAKGLAGRTVLIRHTLKNAMLPVVTVIAFAIAGLFSGSVIIERMFGIPGMGRMAVDAIFQRDYPIIQAVVLLFAVILVVTNLITDLVYGLLDPRIRLS